MAKKEMESKDKEGLWDTVIINDRLEDAYARLRDFLRERYPL